MQLDVTAMPKAVYPLDKLSVNASLRPGSPLSDTSTW